MAVEFENFDFDPEQLREKYREERDKRLRQDGNDQYIEVKGEFAYFEEDPYVEEKIIRDNFKHFIVDEKKGLKNDHIENALHYTIL